ncbi:MAG: GAF domain-containing sensor histidine kinase [Chloroflexi bacterium]|nr:GAF domain-containing sensor histidine kinase [Chloroflexota bacterium]
MTQEVNDQLRIPVDDIRAHYQRIIEISQQLNSTLDLKSLLRKIISAATELTQTEAASIMLIDPATGELRFEIASNMNPNEMEDIIVPLEGSIAGWIVTHGEPRVINDVRQEPNWFGKVDETIEFQTQNLIGVPMKTHNKVIGVLEAMNKNNNQLFTDDDFATLTTLASQAAIAIENARLFQQSDFIAEMVHELRTPLAALKASTTLLQRPNLPDERRSDIISTMQGETERLIRMTSEFLDLARLESGRAKLEVKPFELLKLLNESIEVVLPQANEKGIKPLVEGDDYVIHGDRGKVKQVLLNLLTNAIKYNKENGQIFVTTSAETNKNGVRMARIAVRDTGYGISKENQKHMFQKFFRVADTAGFTQGTGLGLAIAKHISEAHGGEIWLESEVGSGTTFFLTLPLEG